MGIALPSAPAGLGVFEGALVGALAVLGVDQSKSFGMALVLHAIQIIATFILGGYGLLRQGWTLQKLLNQVKIKRSLREILMAMKTLITGGAGFIGSNYAHRLLERGEEIILFDNLVPQRSQA